MLTIDIENQEIVIRCSFDGLRFATEQHEDIATFNEETNNFREVTITDTHAWAHAILRALRAEEEDGSTSVSRILDDAILEAVEQGGEGIQIEGILP